MEQFKQFFLLTILLLSIQNIKSQHCAVKYITAKDIPALDNIKALHIDSFGLLWIGTYSKGLLCYNGKTFETINRNNGLNTNCITEIFEFPSGHIWAGSGENGINQIHKNQVTQIISNPYNFITRSTINNQMILGMNDGLYQINLLNKNITKDTASWYSKIYKYPISNHHYINPINKQIIVFDENNWKILNSIDKNSCIINSIALSRSKIIGFYKNKFLYTCNDTLFSIEWDNTRNVKEKIELIIPGKIQDIKINNNNIILDFFIKPNKHYIRKYNALENNSYTEFAYTFSSEISHIVIDHGGNYWCSSSSGLLKIIPTILEFTKNDLENSHPIWNIGEDKIGNIWFGSEHGSLRYYNGYQIKPVKKEFANFTSFLNCSTNDKNGNLLLNSNAGILFIQSPDIITKINNNTLSYYLGLNKKNNIIVGMGHYNGLWISKNNPIIDHDTNWIKINKNKGLLLKNVLTASEDKYGNYWLGRLSEGISIYNKIRDTVINFAIKNNNKHLGLISSVSDNLGNIWLGTDNGLYFAESILFKDTVQNILNYVKLIAKDIIGTSTVNSLIINDNLLFIGNEFGISILDLKDYYAGKTNIFNINQEFGYLGGPIIQNSMIIDKKNQLWVAGAMHVSLIKFQHIIKDSLIPSIKIDKIIIQGLEFIPSNLPITIDKGIAFFTIKVSHENCPYLYNNIKYQYRLDNNEFSPFLENPEILISNLTVGKHSLELRAIKNGNIFSKSEYLYFTKSGYWWEIKWIWWLTGSSIIALSIFLIFKNLELEKEKSEKLSLLLKSEIDKKERYNLQVQAIVNQLNPHFLNNVLQWVQLRLINDKDALKVIGKLAENLKIVFKNSRARKSFHNLDEEIALVANYLLIQKYRFGKKIEYTITDSKNIEKILSISVPIMILQIHCENACEHGLRHQENGGSINIIIKDQLDFIYCTIEDDGVGRFRAKEIGSKGTQQGVKMLNELIELYNHQNSVPLKQWYEDDLFTDSDGQKYGTKVHIIIPKKYNYSIS